MDSPSTPPKITTISISGPTLSTLLQTLTSSTRSHSTGYLHGYITPITPPPLSDDTIISPSSPPSLLATITSSSLSPHSHPSPLGRFSSRPSSPLRPSLLDHHLSLSLSSSPSLLLLLTTPINNNIPIHTLDFRAYQFNPHSLSFNPVKVEIANVGPGFRGQYGNFVPRSLLPKMKCHIGLSPMREGESLGERKRVARDQKEIEKYIDGYDVGRLGGLVGSEAVAYSGRVEELYEKMIGKLERLGRLVEDSSAKVLHQVVVFS